MMIAACDGPATQRATEPRRPDPIVAPAPEPRPVEPEELSQWPRSFPQIPGGTALPASRQGAVHVARAGWSSRPSALETLLRAELASAGWSASETTIDEDVLRFVARKEDREIAVSIYADEGRAIIQTMEIALD